MRPTASVPVLALALAVLLPLAAPAAGAPLAPSLLGPMRTLPIVVVGDVGFLAPPDQSGVRGGSGTAEDPYRIEGWTIASLAVNPTVGHTGYANAWGVCITLANTQAHAVVRLNTVRGNNCHAVWLQNASNVRVEHNELTHNTGHGVFVDSFSSPALGHIGASVHIRSNVIKGNGFDGIRAFHTPGVVVEHNLLVANANFGLNSRSTPGIVVRGNVADYNGVTGLTVEMAHGALLERNVARSNPTGLDVEFSDDVVVRHNRAEDNRDLGIYTSEMSHRTLVEGNVVLRNGRQGSGWNDGIALNGAAQVARGNVVLDNGDGIASLDGSAFIAGNLVAGNARGVRLEACPGAVRDNGVHGNAVGVGIAEGLGCGPGRVAGNNIAGNAIGARAEAGASADLAGNWWGDAAGPSAPGHPTHGDRVEGDVVTAPWLAAPNPHAPG